MELFTEEEYEKLLRNGLGWQLGRGTSFEPDFYPVVKLFGPMGSAIWLIASLDPKDPDIAYGLFDLGMGFTVLGYVSIKELRALRNRLGMSIERDQNWTASRPLNQYAEVARLDRFIKA